MNTKRFFLSTLLTLATAYASSAWSQATIEVPDALVKRLAVEITEAVKADKNLAAGDIAKVAALIDTKVIPFVNFQRMTASSVGPAWRSATPEQ